MTYRTRQTSLVICGLLGLIILFQNCGRVGQESLETAPVAFDFKTALAGFHYPYTSKPDYFAQIQLARSASSSDFSEVSYLATVAKSDRSDVAVDYELTILNQNGSPVCPERVGRLSEGGTSVVGSCLSQVEASSITLNFKVIVDGETLEFSKTY